jgi:hypothetical protein
VSASSQIVTGKKDGTKQSDYGTFGRYVETPVDRMSPEMNSNASSTKKLLAQCQAHTRFGPVIRNFQRQLSRRARTSKLNRLEDEL